MTGIALPVIAASAALMSVGMLRYAWRRPSRRHAAALGGWVAVAVSLMLYSSARGAEVGVPFAVDVFSLGGIAAVLANIEIRVPKKMRSRERSTPPADSRSSHAERGAANADGRRAHRTDGLTSYSSCWRWR